MFKREAFLSGAVLLLVSQPAVAQPSPSYPQTIPSSGGEVVLGNQYDKLNYDDVKYAPARRVGDMLYVSGTVVTLREGDPETVDSFKDAARDACSGGSILC